MNISEAIKIHLENLAELSVRESRNSRQRELSVAALGELMADISSEGAEQAYTKMRKQGALSTADRAIACLALTNKLSCGGLWSHDFLKHKAASAPGSHGKIAFVKNNYNEKAFEIFSGTVTRAKPVHSTSFFNACEDVYNDLCEFCILPTESTQSGKLLSFYAMLDRYELKICALCSIDTDDGRESVKYALVGKNMPDRLPKSEALCFECSVLSMEGSLSTDIISAASALGIGIVGIYSLPLSYDNSQQKYFFTFLASEKSICAMELFLSSEHRGYTPIGIYPHLS